MEEWRLLWTDKHVSKAGQHCRRIKKDKEKDLIELIKYGSKIFTEPDLKMKGKQGVPRHIYTAALDNILVAMKGLRLFDRFGFDLHDTAKRPKEPSKALRRYKEWVFDPKLSDWVNSNTDEVLSGYCLPPDLAFLLDYRIDVRLE